MSKPVMIFGASGLGKAALGIFQSNNVVVYGFLDDDQDLHGRQIQEVPVLGAIENEAFLKILGKKCDAFLAIDDNALKAALVQSLRKDLKVMPVNAIHQKASVAESAVLHHGNFIDQFVAIGTHAVLGNHCLLHAGAILNYECKVGDFVQIGAGAIINEGASIGDHVFIGSGALVVSGVKVGEGARIGAGSVVIADIDKNATVFGNPAKPVS
jgi:sugar O-acyltransferase (sialic acid O-acetyltransferase NeuD family)